MSGSDEPSAPAAARGGRRTAAHLARARRAGAGHRGAGSGRPEADSRGSAPGLAAGPWAASPDRQDQHRRLADLRLVPVAAAAWAGAWLGTEWSWLTFVGVALGAAILVVGAARRSWWVRAAGITLLLCVALGGVRGWQADGSKLRELAAAGSAGLIEAEVASEPRIVADAGWRSSWTARVRVLRFVQGSAEWVGAEEVVLRAALAQPWRELVVGARIRVGVTLAPPQNRSAVVAIARARGQPTVIAGPDAFMGAVERVRAGLRAAVADRPPEVRGLVPALVVGDTSGADPDLEADFRTTGLTHLTAVSGANLTILLAFVGLAARWLGVRGWWLRIVAVLAVVGYVLLCRAEPSVLRAAAMGGVALAAIGRGRGSAGIRPLAAAVFVILVLDPWMCRSIGFILSVLATAGIMLWTRPWADCLQAWLPRPLAEAITLPVAAQVATQPVVSLISGQISIVGIVANLLAGPLVGPATVLGFLAAGSSVVVPPLATLLGWLASWCAQVIVWIAQVGAALPGAGMTWPTTPLAAVLLTCGCLGAVLVLPVVLRRAWAVLLVVLALGAVCFVGPPRPGWPPSSWQVAVCDVGQGDAFLIRAGPATAFLIDTGPEPRPVSACLRGLGVTAVPLVFLTHFHADHIGGLSAALATGSVRTVVVGPAGQESPAGAGVAAEARRQGVEVRTAAAGDRYTAGGVEVQILAADRLAPGGAVGSDRESPAENDAALAILVTWQGLSMLLVGDREPTGQDRLVRSGVPDVDILAVPHHGSSRQSAEFLRQAAPEIAVISVGEKNTYGHPAARTLSALAGLGATVFRTDQRGTIAIGAGPTGLEVTSER